MFVVGEMCIIGNMVNGGDRDGRLRLLSKLAHWMCRCRDWPLARGLYEGIIESVELGEASWVEDFGHYETMIPVHTTTDIKRESEHHRGTKDRKVETYWCKAYQRNTCTERSLHMALIRHDEPPALMVHVCASCMQKEGRREEHPEIECPKK